MAEKYKVIYEGGEGEVVEKKSRFIATVCPAKTEEEAVEFIESVRKKYWDARHNCYAYVVGKNREYLRCSDDGEPQGTAGKPMLDVLLGENLHDVAVVVTRYFGGVLLGTGGLVRAYSSAVKAGLASSVIITKIPGVKLEIRTDYSGVGKIQYILGQREIPVTASDYTDTVYMEVLVAESEKEAVIKEIVEGTSGQAKVSETEFCWFAYAGGEHIIFQT